MINLIKWFCDVVLSLATWDFDEFKRLTTLENPKIDNEEYQKMRKIFDGDEEE